jgi:MinD superfamily P-loop ATPase
VRIAIASGKGGTGKTTVATNLAVAAMQSGAGVCYLDCDVEEPNGHLFLKPTFDTCSVATIPVPAVDESLCTGCGDCAKMCQYGAVARLGSKVLVFAELCHGCGGCALVCEAGAIQEVARPIGVVESGSASGIQFVHGRLDVGQVMSPPLIREVLRAGAGKAAAGSAHTIIDSPPGTSCPAIAAVRTADLVVLVTEPTPFGLSDLALMLDAVREVRLRCAVVVNQHVQGNDLAREFCAQQGVVILAELPYDRRVAETYSAGTVAYGAVPGYSAMADDLWHSVLELAEGGAGR